MIGLLLPLFLASVVDAVSVDEAKLALAENPSCVSPRCTSLSRVLLY